MTSKSKIKKTIAAMLAVLSLASFSEAATTNLGFSMLNDYSLVASAYSNCVLTILAKTESGKLVPNVSCIVKNKKTGTVVASGNTDINGKIRFAIPTDATYTISCNCNGTSTADCDLTLSSINASATYTATFPDSILGTNKCKETIKVMDMANTPLSGVNCTIYNKNTKKAIASGTTNAEGIVTLEVPKNAEYVVKATYNGIDSINEIAETETSSGHTLSFYFDRGSGVCKINVYIKGSSGNPLKGATCVIYEKTTQKAVSSAISDKNGKISVEVPSGKAYVLKCSFAGEERTIEVRNGVSTFDWNTTFLNQSSVLLYYKDKSNRLISGATFGICKDVNGDGKYDPNIDTFIKKLTSDDGSFLFDNLEVNQKYLIKQMQAPKGCTCDNTIYPFELKESDVGNCVELAVEQPDFSQKTNGKANAGFIYKFSGKLVKGAKFSICCDLNKDGKFTNGIDNKYIKTITSNDGTYIFKGLEVNKTYFIIQTEASTGNKEITNKIFYFTLTSADTGKNVEILKRIKRATIA